MYYENKGIFIYFKYNSELNVEVLFVADLRLDWNNYKKRMAGTVTARTIITENPCFADADELREHARTAPTVPSLILDQLATNFPDRQFNFYS